MKRLVSLLLAITFIMQSTSQLWIVGVFYANRDYIAKNLCINRFDAIPVCKGSCYLEEKLQQDQKQQQNSHPDLKVKEVLLFAYTPTLTIEHNKYYTIYKKDTILIRDFDFTPQEYILSIFHPPDAIV